MFSAKLNRKTNITAKDLKAMLKSKGVKVGLPASVGAKMHDESDLSVAAIGAIHEFGSPARNIPERSFIRTTVQEEQNNIKKLFKKEAEKLMDGEQDVDGMLGIVGAYISAKIKKKITDIKTPPNAEATVEAKGSSNPLIDSGQMRQSVTWEIVND